MPRATANIEGMELVFTDTFITGANETAVLMPFADDNEYKLKFTVRTDGENKISNNIQVEDDGVLAIEHFRPTNLVLATATRVGPNFAHDGDFDYFISFSVMPCRGPVAVIYQVVYNVLRRPA
ncbi:hypothetical protein MKK88_17620 [Methylobacterium sp. E-005]|uniref:hypothetical protein n=1 Tax=Methylobacterium sp. E-005 TaxID=2836549 RepID=UPI001FB980B0|nr:hypothetical protein [Methylobacterium sp. E-005]MCJ2087785.1 hypothetical protein [Methylobacterium sp. E-005]